MLSIQWAQQNEWQNISCSISSARISDKNMLNSFSFAFQSAMNASEWTSEWTKYKKTKKNVWNNRSKQIIENGDDDDDDRIKIHSRKTARVYNSVLSAQPNEYTQHDDERKWRRCKVNLPISCRMHCCQLYTQLFFSFHFFREYALSVCKRISAQVEQRLQPRERERERVRERTTPMSRDIKMRASREYIYAYNHLS